MSKEELMQGIKDGEGLVISDATHRLDHLLSAAIDLLEVYEITDNPFSYIHPQSFTKQLRGLFRTTEGYTETDIEGAAYVNTYYGYWEIKDESEAWLYWEAVFDLFQDLSPDGYYFGTHEEDGSSFGWFPTEGGQD